MVGIRKINQGILHLPLYGSKNTKNLFFFLVIEYYLVVNVQNFETERELCLKDFDFNILFFSSFFSSSRIVSICLSIKKKKKIRTHSSRFFAINIEEIFKDIQFIEIIRYLSLFANFVRKFPQSLCPANIYYFPRNFETCVYRANLSDLT